MDEDYATGSDIDINEDEFLSHDHEKEVYVITNSSSVKKKSPRFNHNHQIQIHNYLLIFSLSIAIRFGYLDHHCVCLYDGDGVLRFLTKKHVRFFNHHADWFTIFDPGEASTICNRAFLVIFLFRSASDDLFLTTSLY